MFVLNAFRFVHFLTRNMRLYVCVKGFGWGDVWTAINCFHGWHSFFPKYISRLFIFLTFNDDYIIQSKLISNIGNWTHKYRQIECFSTVYKNRNNLFFTFIFHLKNNKPAHLKHYLIHLINCYMYWFSNLKTLILLIDMLL